MTTIPLFTTPLRNVEPATMKQLSFIRKLVTEKTEGLELSTWLDVLAQVENFELDYSKAQASRSIDILLSKPRLNTVAAAPAAKPAELEDGIYLLNGKVVKVVHAVHGSGNQYGKVLNTDTGSWDYTPGIVRRLTADDKLTLEKAKEYGQLYGMCMVCGRTLTDEVSIEQGIGPVCAGRL